MNVDRTTDIQTYRQTVKMKGKGGDNAVDLIILIFSSHSMTLLEMRGKKSNNK